MALVLVALAAGGCAQQAPLRQAPQAASPSEPPLLSATALRPDRPASYTVAPGDTVWDVSARFLNDPWLWPGLSPREGGSGRPLPLYAGDVIALDQQSATPQLQLVKGERPTVKLTPQVRVEVTTQPIPTVSVDAVGPFIEHASVMTREQWQNAPYIIAHVEDELLPTSGERVFVRGGLLDLPRYRVMRPGREYLDPKTGASLGFAMTYIADAEVLTEDADPALVRLVGAERSALPGDRLVELDDAPPELSFELQPVELDTSGQIIDSLNNVLAISRYSNVAVNLGAYDGVRPGHVLAVYKPERAVTDPLTRDKVNLPEERVGLVMVYKVFDLVSYGLVTESEREIRLLDRVGEP